MTRYKGYYITLRPWLIDNKFLMEGKGPRRIARVAIDFSYLHHGNTGPKAGTTYDEVEEKVTFKNFVPISKHTRFDYECLKNALEDDVDRVPAIVDVIYGRAGFSSEPHKPGEFLGTVHKQGQL